MTPRHVDHVLVWSALLLYVFGAVQKYVSTFHSIYSYSSIHQVLAVYFTSLDQSEQMQPKLATWGLRPL